MNAHVPPAKRWAHYPAVLATLLFRNPHAFGEHVAWSESATAPYVNSVLGARTNREAQQPSPPALTGLAPRCGMHLDENRRGQLLIRVETEIDGADRFSLLGALAGRLAGEKIPVLDGIGKTPSMDDYVAFGAAFAIHGSVAMYHLSGITPEAPTSASAFGGSPVPDAIIIDDDALEAERRATASGKDGPVDMVSIGCPHASIAQLRKAAAMINVSGYPQTPVFYNHTNRSTFDDAAEEGLIDVLTGTGRG